jgi:DNA-directed RNA polymerase specialized sigma24 family protein
VRNQDGEALACYRYEGRDYVRDHHEANCDGDCSGCLPCSEPHCTARKHCSEHVGRGELTCSTCIARTADDLSEIERMYALLPSEAVVKGIGSQAAVLSGPAIDTAEDIEAHKWRQLSIALGRIVGEPEPHGRDPLTVLGWWDIAYREDYDQPTGLRITVGRSVDYLRSVLARVAQDPEQDWPVFAAEIHACRSLLEAVLHDGEQVERGAPCPDCRDAREEGDPEPPALVLKRHEKDRTGASDRWVCGRCRLRMRPADYRRMVGTDNIRYADRLPAREMATRTGVPLGTIQRWAGRRFRGLDKDDQPVYDPPLLRSQGRGEDGRKVYLVAEVERLCDTRRVDVAAQPEPDHVA